MALPPLDYTPRRSIDWRHAARLWASGQRPEEIAQKLEIDIEHFWRHFERSARFRRFVTHAAMLQQAVG